MSIDPSCRRLALCHSPAAFKFLILVELFDDDAIRAPIRENYAYADHMCNLHNVQNRECALGTMQYCWG